MRVIKYNGITLLFLLFMYMLTVNLLSPMFADDYNYSFMWDKSKRIENIIDVFRSQYMHYFEWGGRTVSHTIGQILLMSNKVVSSTLNAIMYVGLVYLIYWHSQGKKPTFKSVYMLLLIIFFCWTCLPSFAETTIWLIGSVNYLWTAVIILCFLLPFRKSILGDGIKDNIINRLIMFILGLTAGWTNENTAVSTLLLLSIFIIYTKVKKRIEVWMLTGLGGAVVGFLFLVLAPGNMVRAAQMGKGEDYSFILYHIKMPAAVTLKIMLIQAPLWIALLVFTLILLTYIKKSRRTISSLYKESGSEIMVSLVFILLSILNNLIMFASPYFPMRAGFGSSVFLMIGVLSLFRIDVIRTTFIQKKAVYTTIISIALLVSMSLVIVKYVQLNEEHQDRLAFIDENINAGNNTVSVSSFSINKANPYDTFLDHVFVSDIGEDPALWPNNIYAKYLGLESIRLEK